MNATILIVDDEVELREMLARHFRMIGYETHMAANGAEGLERMQERKTDIVISDIMMPVMNGIDFLRQVRAQYPMVHTIMMTGMVTLDNALACMRLGADTCVFKPIEDMKELEDAVERAVAELRNWIRILHDLTVMKSHQRESIG